MSGARVGGEFDDRAALLQSVGQRKCWKQMPAGSAGRKQHQRRRGHQAALPSLASSGEVSIAELGCSRVSASNMPMA